MLWDYGADLDLHGKGQYQNGAWRSWAPSWFSPRQACVSASQLHRQGLPLTPLLAHPALLVEKYRKRASPGSSSRQRFKGATGVNQSLTPIEHHQKPPAVAAGGGQCASGHAAGHHPDWLAEVRPRGTRDASSGGSSGSCHSGHMALPAHLKSGPQFFSPSVKGKQSAL